MASNLLEQLAEVEVPPPPDHFDKQLHARVNRTLVAAQFVDLAVSGLALGAAAIRQGLYRADRVQPDRTL